ncbi:MAG: CHC2 zinc finger domain-containing protein [Thermomicrobiales bacterium]
MKGGLFTPLDTNPATRFAGWLAQDLVDLNLHLREERARLLDMDDPSPTIMGTIEVCEVDLADIQAELERRERARLRLGADPLTPRAPQRNDKLMDLARDLRAVWPIDRFCEDLMAMRLTKAGSRYKAHCPLPGHDEKSPSFVLYPEQDRFHCFGCGRYGDIFDLTGHYFRLSRFSDQVRKLAEETGSRLSYEEAS